MKNLKSIVKKTKAMNHLGIFVSILILFSLAKGQTDNFNDRPWQNEKYPLILDPYAPNKVDFEKLIADKRVMSILHQASRGLTHKDDKYKSRAITAKAKGLLYASYHLGLNADPIKQADFYLSVIGENKSQPTALDIEDIGGNNISLPDSERFIKRIFEKTGKYPFVYVNHKVFTEISNKYDKNSIFAKCPLWYARFINKLPQMSKKVWGKVTLWQFASEINCRDTPNNCPYTVPGTANDMDINVFNGSSDELKQVWKDFAATQNENIDSFIKQSLTKSVKTKKQLFRKDFRCGFKEVYFVEGFRANGSLGERFLVYNRNGHFIKSTSFIDWIAAQTKFFEHPFISGTFDENEKSEALNLLVIKLKSLNQVNASYFNKTPENVDSNFDMSFSFVEEEGVKNYGFPTIEECRNE